MGSGKLIVGGILILIAIYLFIAMQDFTAKYLGGGILLILGLIYSFSANVSKEKRRKRNEFNPLDSNFDFSIDSHTSNHSYIHNEKKETRTRKIALFSFLFPKFPQTK